MSFSLSRHSLSRAPGRNGGPLVLVVLFKLLVLFDFVGGAAFRAVIADQVRAESIEWNNLVRISFKNCRARHAADDAGIFALRDGHSPRRLDRTEPLCAIIPHARHQYPDGSEPKLLGHGMKQDIRGWTMSVDARPIGENGLVTARHPSTHHVPISRTNQNPTAEAEITLSPFVTSKK